MAGADEVAVAMSRAGVTHVFGLPGTQNASLYAALAHSRIRAVLTGSELMASFMASGFWRAGGSVPVVAAIPGPGFSYALPGLAEAALDNAAFVLVTGVPANRPDRQFGLQALDQAGMVKGLARAVLRLEHVTDAERVLAEAVHAAVANGPGPVLVEVAAGVLNAPATSDSGPRFVAEAPAAVSPQVMTDVVDRLRSARKVVVIAGQGTASCPDGIAALVARRPAMVLTTVSARGVLPETHPWSLAYDFLACSVDETNRLLEEADLVLVLGCRTSHNGTGGFRLRLPEDRTARVDVDPDALGANYAPRWPLRTSVPTFLSAVLAQMGTDEIASHWTPTDVKTWRDRLRRANRPNPPEPLFPGTEHARAAEFFAALQNALPRDAIVVTDTGHHQIMAREHLRIDSPRGLIVPSDFQSMGFGLPAAIGAALAAPHRRVIAILGDGGLMISGLELATAVRERIDLTAIVFNDGHLGQIRTQQWNSGEGDHAVDVAPIDFEALAAATGAGYVIAQEDAQKALSQACQSRGVVLVDVPLRDSPAMRRARRSGHTRGFAKRLLGRHGNRVLRRLLGRS